YPGYDPTTGDDPLVYFTFYDNLFEKTRLTNVLYVAFAYNGYLTNQDRIASAHDVVLTNLDYQLGPLGSYYYPTNGGYLSRLINAGSRSADLAGLFHYTTQTNQVRETNSTVDIGLHYVAVDANGNPFDTDQDGVPDYLADQNGNGRYDSGETPWNC